MCEPSKKEEKKVTKLREKVSAENEKKEKHKDMSLTSLSNLSICCETLKVDFEEKKICLKCLDLCDFSIFVVLCYCTHDHNRCSIQSY